MQNIQKLLSVFTNVQTCKFIFVTGGVMSGLGKGVTASSIAKLLQLADQKVSCVKIDPYLNYDAGTMNPIAHGEVFVTEDGGECDMDIGNYERFLNQNLTKSHNITTAQVYASVIEAERSGKYLGACVQIIPHVTDEIKRRIRAIASGSAQNPETKPDFLIVECGGTVGDIESLPFLEALRQMRVEHGHQNVLFVHVTLAPELDVVGEQKTKPTQHSAQELRRIGIQPDFLAVRCTSPLGEKTKQKIAMFTNVTSKDVLSCHDVSSIFQVPQVLYEQGILDSIYTRFGIFGMLNTSSRWNAWNSIVENIANPTGDTINIAMVGKYVTLADSYVSVNHALKHAGAAISSRVNIDWIDSETICGGGGDMCTGDNSGGGNSNDMHDGNNSSNHNDTVRGVSNGDDAMFNNLSSNNNNNCSSSNNNTNTSNDISRLSSYDGILVPGGFGTRGSEGIISVATFARENNIPYLGICFGFQLASIAFCRSVLEMDDANSTEITPDTKYPIVDILPEQQNVSDMGGSLRLGAHDVDIFNNTLAHNIYNLNTITKRHRHRYEINRKFIPQMREKGLVFSAQSDSGKRMEILEIPSHKFYMGVQFHPEFNSRPGFPEASFAAFIKTAASK